MLPPQSDLAVLLKAMGEYQAQQHTATGDVVAPTMVQKDRTFHEARTGFTREQICSLLPQLVAAGLAEVLGQGKGMPFGYRASDGFAWISAEGQRQLPAWDHPAPPLQVETAGLSPQAEARLRELLRQASTLVTPRVDIDSLEEILTDIAGNAETDTTENAARLVQVLEGNGDLSTFVVVCALPYICFSTSRRSALI